MIYNIKFRISLYVIMLIMPLTLMAGTPSTDSVRTFNVGGKTLTEDMRVYTYKTGVKDVFYSYSVRDMNNYIDSVKANSKLLPNNLGYTLWNDRKLLDKESNDLKRLVRKSLINDNNDSTVIEDKVVWNIHFMLEGNGKVTLSKLDSRQSLLTLYSPSELCHIIDNISKFRYSYPITKGDSSGYIMLDLQLFTGAELRKLVK